MMQTPDDIHRLARREGVTHILNLQQDKDIRYWRVVMRISKHPHQVLFFFLVSFAFALSCFEYVFDH